MTTTDTAIPFGNALVVRFAPAPTGRLHLGHVLNAIWVWGVARARGGRVLLRIEDHDRQRSRPAYEQAILDDLEWLGFVPDSPAVAELRGGVSVEGRQSDRQAIYASALDVLRARGLIYACECSRKDVASSALSGGEPRYSGTCAGKQLPETSDVGLRVRLAPAVERFSDLRHGRQEQEPFQQCGDLLVLDRKGNWTYQFVATVDDMQQGVTLVVRGDDLLASTGRQIQLARLLGRSHPARYLHHPLIMKSAGQKLSKSDGDSGICDLRARGWSPAEVIGEAAWRGGLIAGREAIGPDRASELVIVSTADSQ